VLTAPTEEDFFSLESPPAMASLEFPSVLQLWIMAVYYFLPSPDLWPQKLWPNNPQARSAEKKKKKKGEKKGLDALRKNKRI
jgi:hypothetical protein